MYCLSDIDLPTLHKTRLEERVHYKLSWWTRRLLNEKKERQSMISRVNHTKRYNQRNLTDLKNTDSVDSILERCGTDDGTSSELDFLNCETPYKNQVNIDDDDGYFSSTTRRRRSGTWP